MTTPHKILLRDFVFKNDYQDWLLFQKQEDIEKMQSIYEQYLMHNYLKDAQYEIGQGFEAFLWKNTLNVNFPFVMDYWRAKVIKLRYYNYVSDQKTEYLDGGIKRIYERHYLKPLSGIKIEKEMEASYGNVLIEVCLDQNKTAICIKLAVTKYPDVSYQSFESLLSILVG